MPSPMVHLYAAQIIEPRAPNSFFLGSIAPDYIGNRILKDHAHFRDVDNRLDALARFGAQLDSDNAFERGWFFHLFIDACWDEVEIPRYKYYQFEIGNEAAWFSEYRNEISLLSCHLYHHLDVGSRILDKIKVPDSVKTKLNIDDNQIEWYRELIIEKHEMSPPDITPHFYSLEEVESFSHQAIDEYLKWNRETGIKF